MIKVCSKCGAENKDYSGAPDAACPSCGVIYAKAESPQIRQPKRAASPQRPQKTDESSPLISKIFYVLAIFSVIGGLSLFYDLSPKPGEEYIWFVSLAAKAYLWGGLFQGLLFWAIGLALKYLRGIYLRANG